MRITAPPYKPTYPEKVRLLCLLGASMEEIAEFFGITVKQLAAWRVKYPKLDETIRASVLEATGRVVDALYQRAIGYTHPETKVFCHQGDIYTHEVLKHYPPDTTAALAWLAAHRGDIWRKASEGEEGGPPPPVNIRINMHPEMKHKK